MANDPSKRFSQLYLARGEPTNDSTRFRRRIAQEFQALVGNERDAFGKHLVSEAGADVPHTAGIHFFPKQTFLEGELRDVLDGHRVLPLACGQTAD